MHSDHDSTSQATIIPPETLISAYSQGIFPMSEHKEDNEVDWYSATRRGIIPMDQFRVSSNVQRLIRQGNFEVRYNSAFREVVKACSDRETSWISPVIIESYQRLHEMGYAHSVEIWKEKKLKGGLYGVALRGAFFGESMFKNDKELDKIALYFCHQRLKERRFKLWDTQFYTEHLSQFGCIEISAEEYEEHLQQAMDFRAFFD
jgi:leucyl/phenylalanyl-tRNA--protein transferase